MGSMNFGSLQSYPENRRNCSTGRCRAVTSPGWRHRRSQIRVQMMNRIFITANKDEFDGVLKDQAEHPWEQGEGNTLAM